jgi:hypothetical protein
VAKYLFLHGRTDPFEPIKLRDRIYLACRIGMSVVSSDDQTVLAGKIENMWDVVVRLASDKNIAFME